jgi:hypothetical protein
VHLFSSGKSYVLALTAANEIQNGPTDTMFNLIVGDKVTNCDGATTSVQSQITGSISLIDSWSVGIDIGIGFKKDLDLGVVGNWSQSTETTYSQSITITVDPGQQVRLTRSFNVISPSSRVCSLPKSSISRLVAPYRSTAGKATPLQWRFHC